MRLGALPDLGAPRVCAITAGQSARGIDAGAGAQLQVLGRWEGDVVGVEQLLQLLDPCFEVEDVATSQVSVEAQNIDGRCAVSCLPSRNLLLCDGVVSDAGNAGLGAAGAAGQLLVASVLAEAAAVAGAHVAKVAALAGLAAGAGAAKSGEGIALLFRRAGLPVLRRAAVVGLLPLALGTGLGIGRRRTMRGHIARPHEGNLSHAVSVGSRRTRIDRSAES